MPVIGAEFELKLVITVVTEDLRPHEGGDGGAFVGLAPARLN